MNHNEQEHEEEQTLVSIEQTDYGCNLKGKSDQVIKAALALVYAEYVKDTETPRDDNSKAWRMVHGIETDCTTYLEVTRLLAAKEVPWHSDIKTNSFPTANNSMYMEFAYEIPAKQQP